MSEYSLGIDIGGTFTDLVIHDHDTGRRWGSKVLTTHADPQQGVVAGVRTILAESGLDPRSIGRVVHATTLFTNALIERKGAPTGLLVTDGFRDTLEIGRERKYELYESTSTSPRRWCRATCGSVSRAHARRRQRRRTARSRHSSCARSTCCAPAGSTSVAMVFLHAYANPAQRSRLRAPSRAHPGAMSSRRRIEVAPRDPRVRARLHDRRQRLHQAARRGLSRRLGERTDRPRHRGAAAADAV